MSKKKPSSDIISPAEMRELMYDQQRMNNPNVNNAYGGSETTFGPDGQAQISQTFSPEMQGLFDMQVSQLSQGAPQYEGGRDSYYSGMGGQFGERMANRGGFQAPQMSSGQQMPQAGSIGITDGPQAPIIPNDPINQPVPNGIGLPNMPTRPRNPIKEDGGNDWRTRLKTAGNVMQSENPLVEALMAMQKRGGL